MPFNFDDLDEGGEPETYSSPLSKLLSLEDVPPSDTEVRNGCKPCRYASYRVIAKFSVDFSVQKSKTPV